MLPGNVIVIWLFAVADIPPVEEVVKLTTYSVRAPAAVDGGLPRHRRLRDRLAVDDGVVGGGEVGRSEVVETVRGPLWSARGMGW